MNQKMVTALRLYRLSRGLDPEPQPDDTAPLLYSLYGDNVPLTTRMSIYRVVKDIFQQASVLVDGESQVKLKQASTHWIRHIFATRAHAVGISTSLRKEALGHSNVTGHIATYFQCWHFDIKFLLSHGQEKTHAFNNP